MILNAYAVIVGFLCLLRVPLGVLVTWLAIRLGRRAARPLSTDELQRWEELSYLAILSSCVLLGLNLAGWPIFYALLQSYVPQWPGVMCIYGVTRIGLGSTGASGYLPGLVATLQILKPLLVFASGAWFTLYVVDRRTRNSPIAVNMLAAIAGFGVLSLVDAGLEIAYLVIPKAERFLEAGCCTAIIEGAERAGWLTPKTGFSPAARTWLTIAFFGGHGLLAAALVAPRRRWLAPLGSGGAAGGFVLAAAFLALPGYLFLVEIAAPKILRLPYHHCLYDLLPRAPESVLGLVMLAVGTLMVTWAAVAHGAARSAETDGAARRVAQRLHFVGGWAYAGAITLLGVELALS